MGPYANHWFAYGPFVFSSRKFSIRNRVADPESL